MVVCGGDTPLTTGGRPFLCFGRVRILPCTPHRGYAAFVAPARRPPPPHARLFLARQSSNPLCRSRFRARSAISFHRIPAPAPAAPIAADRPRPRRQPIAQTIQRTRQPSPAAPSHAQSPSLAGSASTRTRTHTHAHAATAPRTHAPTQQPGKTARKVPTIPQTVPNSVPMQTMRINITAAEKPPAGASPWGGGPNARDTHAPAPHTPRQRPHPRPDPRRPAPPMPPSQPHAPARQPTPARTNAPRQPDAPPAPHTGAPHHTSTTRIQIQKERCTTRTHTHRTALQSSR